MSMSFVALLFLFGAIALGFVKKSNVGLISLGAVLILGKLGNLPLKKMYVGFPGKLFLTLLGTMFFFALLQENGTLDKASKKNGNVIGGFRASPVVGTGLLKDMVFFTASSVTSVGSSASPSMVFALDKESGEVMWTKRLDVYTYASPVAVYTEDGQAFLIQPDSSGILHLLDGMSGSEVSSLQLEGTINASPAVYKDTLVIGTQGKDTSYIYGISLK